MAYTLGYAAHIGELFGFRAWLVTFLVFVFAQQPGLAAGSWTPTQVATVLLLIGMPASIAGNEIATAFGRRRSVAVFMIASGGIALGLGFLASAPLRSEEHTSELQSLMRISYAVFCLKK